MKSIPLKINPLAAGLALALAGLFILSSCAKKETIVEPLPPRTSVHGTLEPETAPVSPGTEEPEKTPAPVAPNSYPALPGFPAQALYFDSGSAILTARAKEVIEKKALWLYENPDIALIVQGHCDVRGKKAHNLSLGLKRAQAVKEFLLDLGIPEKRISCMSFGESRPAVAGITHEIHGKNRRVEFKIQPLEN